MRLFLEFRSNLVHYFDGLLYKAIQRGHRYAPTTYYACCFSDGYLGV